MRPFSIELVLFLLVSSILMAVIYSYVCWKFVTHTRLPRSAARAVWGIVLALFILNPLSFVFGMSLGRSAFSSVLSWISYIGLGFMTVAAALLLIWDAVRLAGYHATRLHRAFRAPRFVREESSEAVTRREFLHQSVNIGLIGAAALMGAHGFHEARRLPRIADVAVPISGLPRSLEGFRIAQITDIHLGPTIGADFLAGVVKAVNSLAPDIVAVTGDLVDGTVELLGDQAAPLSDLHAKHGVFFVTGNHEYYSGVSGWLKELARLGLVVLLNEHRQLRHGTGRVLVAGVPDYTAQRIEPSHRSDPALALSGSPESDVKILLAHQPRNIYEAAKAGFDLQVSGHTHGGQYFPGNLLVTLAQPYVHGLHRHGKTWIYVSRGTGYWGPPFRIGAPSEITLLRLTCA